MKIYGFNNGNLASCGMDTRCLSDEELIENLNKQLENEKNHLAKLEEEMSMFVKLHNSYRYAEYENIGRCFVDMCSVKSEILDIEKKILRIGK